jgi:hypothetical protein
MQSQPGVKSPEAEDLAQIPRAARKNDRNIKFNRLIEFLS